MDPRSRLYGELSKLHVYHQQAGELLVKEMLKIWEENASETTDQTARLETQIADLTARLEQIHKLSGAD